jgi:hypothetical protein
MPTRRHCLERAYTSTKTARAQSAIRGGHRNSRQARVGKTVVFLPDLCFARLTKIFEARANSVFDRECAHDASRTKVPSRRSGRLKIFRFGDPSLRALAPLSVEVAQRRVEATRIA